MAIAATVLFIGGIIAAGLGLREDGSANGAAAVSAAPEVIHKRKIRTVHVPASRPAATAVPAVMAATEAPAPTPVSSRTSPGGAGAGDDEGEEHSEVERGESD